MAGEEKELREKIGALSARRFGPGDHSALLFAAYDADNDGQLRPKEIEKLLEDAGIGTFITRVRWVEELLKRLDENYSGGVSYDELGEAIKVQPMGPPPPPGHNRIPAPRPVPPIPIDPPGRGAAGGGGALVAAAVFAVLGFVAWRTR